MNDRKPIGIRLEAGSRLSESIENTVTHLSLPFCDVTGFGALEWISLASDDSDKPRRFQGPFQLLTLRGRLRQAGNVTLSDFVCSVSRETENGIQVLGGRLVDGAALFLELTFTPLDVLENAEISAPTTGVPRIEPTPSKTEGSQSDLKGRWASAVQEARRLQNDADFMDDNETDKRPSRGDIVQHAQFGECKVARMTDDHITLRKPDGRNVQLGLPILKFFHEGSRDKRTVFRVEVKVKQR